ncbi:TlpA family protein disulfide reductase [Persephonella sp.]
MKNIAVHILVSILFTFSFSFAKKIPRFELKDETGKIVKRDDLKGKPAVIVFWGINCLSCKEELPMLNKLYQKYGKKINFYAVVIDSKDINEIRETKNLWKFELPVLIGDYSMLYKFRIIGTPTTIIIDKDLDIYKKLIGPQPEDKVEKLIKDLLSG